MMKYPQPIKTTIDGKRIKSRLRRKHLVSKILNSNGTTLKEDMLSVGYPISTANNPSIVTHKPNFIELLNRITPDDKLLNVTDKALNAKRTDRADWQIRLKSAELISKLKGHLRTDNQINIQANDYKLVIDDNTQ